MRRCKLLFSLSVLAALCSLASSPLSADHKPNHAPGGGGSGGGDDGGGGNKRAVLIDLHPVDFDRSRAFDLNDFGMVVGDAADFSDFGYAMAWIPGADDYTAVTLDADGEAEAYGVNNLDEIVGIDWLDASSSVDSSAVYWANETAAAVHLPPLEGATFTLALAINDQGIIVGNSAGQSFSAPVVWRVAGGEVSGPFPLPLEVYLTGVARDINSVQDGVCQVVGTVAGESVDGFSSERAALWNIALLADGSLDVQSGIQLSFGDDEVSSAYAISEGGDVGGVKYNPDEGWQAYVTRDGVGAFRDEPRKTGAGGSRVEDLNDLEEVGFSRDLSDGYPVLWQPKASIIDTKPLDEGEEAKAINMFGDIAGFGRLNGDLRAFVIIR